MKKELIRKEETAQGKKVVLYRINTGYEVHLDDAGIFYFDEYTDADTFTGLVSLSDYEPS